jgi:hypothetical protein
MIRAKTFVPRVLPVLAGLLWLSVPAPRAHADSLLFWDFENATNVGSPPGSISTAVGASGNPGIAGFASQTGGGPDENFGGSLGIVHLTRFFGTNYPYIQFTLTRPMYLQSVTFDHIHNHNEGFPTYPSYDTQLQINTGSGFVDIGSPVHLEGSNIPQFGASVTLGVALNLGTYQIRWVPRNLAYGSDTNTEYFALNGVEDYSVKALYDQTKSHKSGSTVPIKIQIVDAAGVNVSSSSILVTATGLTRLDNSASAIVDDSGSADSPDNNFRYDSTLAGYIFNLSSKGLTTGTWVLSFTVGANPTPKSVRFDIK